MKMKQFINDGVITVFNDSLKCPIYKIRMGFNPENDEIVIVTNNFSVSGSTFHYDIETALRYINKDIKRREKIGYLQIC